MSEPGIGTKSYDPRILAGLKSWLIVNGYDQNLTVALLQGGLIPRVPIYRTDLSKYYMRHLGIDPEKKPGENLTVFEGDLKGDVHEIKQYRRNVQRKIVNTIEAARMSRREMGQIIKTVSCEFHYQWGPYDHENMADIEKLIYVDAQNMTRILGRFRRKEEKQWRQL